MSNEDDADIFTFCQCSRGFKEKIPTCRMQTYRNTIVVVSCLTTVNAFYYGILANKQDFTKKKKHPSFSKLNVIKSTREKKPFRLIGSLRVILKNSKNYSRVVKTALLSTKKKIKEYQAIMCLPYLSDLGGHFSVR